MAKAPTPSGSASPKSFGFGISGLKKFPELIPVVTIVSFAVSGAIMFMIYSLHKKPDIKILRGNGCIKTEWEDVKPTEKRKLRIINPDAYKPIDEVEAIKREIGSFKR